MFPRITHVDIEVDGNDQAIVIVIDAPPVWRPLHPRDDLTARAHPKVTIAGNGCVLVKVIKDVHERIGFRDFDDRPVREYSSNSGLKYSPVVLSMEVVHQQESASQQMFPQVGGLL